MKHAIIGWLAALAACMNQPAPEPVVLDDGAAERSTAEVPLEQPTTGTTAAWQCGGDELYFRWVCDEMIGQWSKVYVGVESWNCGYPPIHTLDGQRTGCHESEMYTCGGGPNDLCNNDDTCSFPPGLCRRKPVDPPPCCLE